MKDLIIIILLLIGHYLGDYSHLSTDEMLEAKSEANPIYPIVVHGVVHGIMVWLALFLVYSIGINISYTTALLLGWFEICTHFVIDLLKGKMNVWYPKVANPNNRIHWYIFGLDQLLHHVVLAVIYLIIVGKITI